MYIRLIGLWNLYFKSNIQFKSCFGDFLQTLMRTVVPLFFSSILVYIRRVMLINMHSSYSGGVVNLVQSLYDLVVFFIVTEMSI
jgi:hypothetical protein